MDISALETATGTDLNIAGAIGPNAWNDMLDVLEAALPIASAPQRNIKDFGAIGDGATDDTAAFTAAFAALAGTALYLPPGTYRLTHSSALTTTGKDVVIVGAAGAVIDVTDVTAATVFAFNGSMGTWYLLGASPAAGDRAITAHATLAASLVEGDLVRLTTNTTHGGSGETWRGLGSTYYKGEIVEVLSVSGTTVNLKSALADSYTAANTVAAKMTGIRVQLDNLVMTGDITRTQIAVDATYLRSLAVTGGALTGFGHTCLNASYVAHGIITGYRASNFWKSGVGNNYGICLNSSQDVSVTGCHIAGGRHAVTTGGLEPNRWITIGPGNTLDSDVAATAPSLFPHANTEHLRIVGNFIRNGVMTTDTPNTVIEGNTIEMTISGMPGINASFEHDTDSLLIRHNLIRRADAFSASGSPAIQVSGQTSATKTVKDVAIHGNDIRGSMQAVSVSRVSGVFTIAVLRVTENTINETDTRTPLQFAGVDTTDRLVIGDLTIDRNRIYSTYAYAVNILSTNITTLRVTRNHVTLHGAGGGNPVLTQSTTTVTRGWCDDNVFLNTSTAAAYLDLIAVDFLSLRGNYVQNFSANGGARLSATVILARDNTKQTVTGNFSITAGEPCALHLEGTVADGWHDTDTASGDTEAGYIAVMINGNKRYIATYSDAPSV